MSEIRSVEFRVYLEGVLLPEDAVQAVELQVRPGQPKSFQVMLPPFALGIVKQIRPRTHIAVFFKDELGEDFDTSWKLWAEGEVTGYRFAKRASGSINVVLMTEGIENYWAYTYALHFQSAKSLSGSNLHDNKVLFGTAGRVLTVDFPASDNPIPLQTSILSAIGAAPDTRFPELFIDLFKGIEDLSPFFAAAEGRLRIGDRLSFVKDDEVQQLIDATAVRDLLSRTFSAYPQDSRLISIMQALMANVHYGYQTVPIPPFISGRPAEFIVKPDLPFIAPPRCNVIFPGQMSSFAFKRDFLEEPTRARISLPVGVGPDDGTMLRKHFYAPGEMQGVVQSVKDTEGEAPNIEALLMTGDDLREESREDIKGVIPLVSVFPSYEMLTLGGTSEDARDEYFSQLTDYNLQLAQHQGRVMEITGPFNPMVVCGFPGLVVMGHGVIFGTIQSVSHSLHAGGGSSTKMLLTHCREEDLSQLRAPRWKNAKFADRDQLDQTYAELLGQDHGSIMRPVQGLSELLDTQFRSQTVAAQRLQQAHAGALDQQAFEREYTRRSITRRPDLMGFLKATRNGQDYTGGAFRPEWATAARLVARELAQRVQDAT